MSISSVSASGAGYVGPLLAKMLSQLDQPKAEDASMSPVDATSTPSKEENCKTPAIGGQATLSDKILGLMIALQAHNAGGANQGGDPVAQAFSAIDSDGDGSISQTEMETYVQTVGGTQSQADTLFQALAGDSSDGISKDEFETAAAAGRPEGHHPPHEAGPRAAKPVDIFDTMDTNQDGTVSADEMAAAFSTSETSSDSTSDLFAKIDTNGDKGVTSDELSSYLSSLIEQTRSFSQVAARSYGASENLLRPADTATSIEA